MLGSVNTFSGVLFLHLIYIVSSKNSYILTHLFNLIIINNPSLIKSISFVERFDYLLNIHYNTIINNNFFSKEEYVEPKELLKSYQECAKFIPDSLHMNVNDLINKYIENKDNIKGDSYLSAVVIHYWPKINRMYQKSLPYATFEDAYDWMLDAIMETVNYAPWLDETNKLYTDPAAPDKVINRMVSGIRANWFQAQNRFTRKINMNVLSTDYFLDEAGFEPDEWQPLVQASTQEDNPIYSIVRKMFKSLNYEKAFVLDMIVFDDCKDEKELVDNFRLHLNDTYIDQFANRYDFESENVYTAADYIKAKSTKQLKEIVADRLREIRTQIDVKDLVHV